MNQDDGVALHEVQFKQLVHKVVTSLRIITGFSAKINHTQTVIPATGNQLQARVYHGCQFRRLEEHQQDIIGGLEVHIP
jgi:hypothetical protein